MISGLDFVNRPGQRGGEAEGHCRKIDRKDRMESARIAVVIRVGSAEYQLSGEADCPQLPADFQRSGAPAAVGEAEKLSTELVLNRQAIRHFGRPAVHLDQPTAERGGRQ
jgi:hypothetical protein